jgi:putative NADPH-quinone reductase
MRLLAVFAHPYEGSFDAALLSAVREGADAGGHHLRVLDLYAEGFDPALPAEELRSYNDPDKVPDDLRPHVEALAWAEGIVFVHPTWWGGLPAMAKGWLDRAWRPGHAFHATNGTGLRPGLTQVRILVEVTTTAASRWLDAVTNTAGRRTLFRSMRTCTGLRTRTLRLALHGIDTTTDAQREAFLAKVRARIAALR